MKNRKKIMFLFFLIILIFYSNDVFAKEVANTCTYNYVYDHDGSKTNNEPGNEKDQIIVTIYEDESYELKIVKSQRVTKGEKIKNWGQDFNGIKNIKGKECPDYFIETSEGWFEKSVRVYMFNEENFSEYLKILASKSTTGDVTVMKSDKADETVETKETYTCRYDVTEESFQLPYFFLDIDLNTKKVNARGTTSSGTFSYNVSVSGNLTDDWFNTDGSIGKCLPVTVCSTGSSITPYVTTFSYMVYLDDGATFQDERNEKDCFRTGYTGDNENLKVDEEEYKCPSYKNRIKEIEKLYIQIGEAKQEDKSIPNLYTEVRQLEIELDTMCKGLYKGFSYKSDCVKECVVKDSDISKIKFENGLGVGDGGGTASCSLSERVVGWIFKIIKWIRYLVPILLILLSILDFIKAIASNSEDEMRKVGAKFVKRLIVAAIIFLLPLMLEFLLGIFNIETKDYCLK